RSNGDSVFRVIDSGGIVQTSLWGGGGSSEFHLLNAGNYFDIHGGRGNNFVSIGEPGDATVAFADVTLSADGGGPFDVTIDASSGISGTFDLLIPESAGTALLAPLGTGG